MEDQPDLRSKLDLGSIGKHLGRVDRLPVEEGAVPAAKVFKYVIALPAGQAGLQAGNFGMVDHQTSRGKPPDHQLLLGELDFFSGIRSAFNCQPGS
jgi:hypothetical protein